MNNEEYLSVDHLVFDRNTRDLAIKAIILTIKDYVDQYGTTTTYDPKEYKGGKFGYVMTVGRNDVSKQRFIEIKDVVSNIIDYIFSDENFEIGMFKNEDELQVEITSKF